MKNKLKLLVLFITLTTAVYSCDSKSNNEVAKELFLKNMTLLKRSANENGCNLKDTPKAIEEMEELTEIPSKTNDVLLGKLKPTQGDLIIWEYWYKKNQDKLYWDENDHKIKRMEE